MSDLSIGLLIVVNMAGISSFEVIARIAYAQLLTVTFFDTVLFRQKEGVVYERKAYEKQSENTGC